MGGCIIIPPHKNIHEGVFNIFSFEASWTLKKLSSTHTKLIFIIFFSSFSHHSIFCLFSFRNVREIRQPFGRGKRTSPGFILFKVIVLKNFTWNFIITFHTALCFWLALNIMCQYKLSFERVKQESCGGTWKQVWHFLTSGKLTPSGEHLGQLWVPNISLFPTTCSSFSPVTKKQKRELLSIWVKISHLWPSDELDIRNEREGNRVQL